MTDVEQNPTLENITGAVDRLWAEIKKNRAELQPLIYSAWRLLFAGHRGRPKAGEESFGSWLDQRGIPRRTGYNFLNREQTKRGERIVPVGTIPESAVSDDGTDDDVLEPVADAQAGTVAASGPSGDAIASPAAVRPSTTPIHKAVAVNLKSATAAELKAEREKLVAELKLYLKSDEEVQKTLDRAVIQFLQDQLGPLRKKSVKSVKANHAALKESLQCESWQEAA